MQPSATLFECHPFFILLERIEGLITGDRPKLQEMHSSDTAVKKKPWMLFYGFILTSTPALSPCTRFSLCTDSFKHR